MTRGLARLAGARAHVPRHARDAGASRVIVNLAPTTLGRSAALVLRRAAGGALAAVAHGPGAAPVGAA